jgi:magnesium chelatase family protein
VITTITTTTSQGLYVQPISVEIDISPSLPSIIIVGLPDKAVSESKERIRSGVKQSGYEFPLGKITINLAPADVAKSGSSFDLPIALGILSHTNVVKKIPQKSIFVGELALDGSVRKIPGVLSICKWAVEHNLEQVFIPKDNSAEASLVDGIRIIPVSSLSELVSHLNQEELISSVTREDYNYTSEKIQPLVDFKDIKGQLVAKRALEIAAAGNHNVLLIGEPGSGKTLLSRAMHGILPPLTDQERIEVMEIYSISGKLNHNTILSQRPFRSPHHSSSHISLVGGGSKLMPGEITLAHRGVLFLDEFPEFSRLTLEALRQPLEEGFIDISRASGSVRYPSQFMLIAAANPTPSGFGHNHQMDNSISYNAIKKYQSKFSGPIVDRIDMYVEVNKPETNELLSEAESEPTSSILERVTKVREIQKDRFHSLGLPYHTTSELTAKDIKQVCVLSQEAETILKSAIDRYALSGRGYHRILKLSRTIADFNDRKNIEEDDILESLQYRSRSFLMESK